MHIRVLLSKYRAYTPCTVCDGSRLKQEALLWRAGDKATADAVLEPRMRYRSPGVAWSKSQLLAVAGLTLHDLMLLPIDRCKNFFDAFHDAAQKSDVGAAADHGLGGLVAGERQYQPAGVVGVISDQVHPAGCVYSLRCDHGAHGIGIHRPGLQHSPTCHAQCCPRESSWSTEPRATAPTRCCWW